MNAREIAAINSPISEIFFDGDPTIIGVTDVGSDVGIDNAEICSITANSLEQFSNVCVLKEEYN